MKCLVPFVLALMPMLISAGCSSDDAAEESGSTMTENETGTEVELVDRSDQVLRHAVFFSFKEESSEADIQGVAEAFEALPSKIDSIIDFAWGVNNSTEDKDDGFTHCFLLTFKDEAGRATYLPHPDHAAFGDVLRPHMKDVFVIDWWGTAEPAMPESALQHVVFFKFTDDAAAEDVQAVEAAFAELPTKIDTIQRFEWGTNNSPEKHDDEFTHAFLVTFENAAGRETYLPHPAHLAFVDILKPVLDKVRVLDFTVSK
ncbi:MAG: Dabb family protein [Fuerstiella sp.]